MRDLICFIFAATHISSLHVIVPIIQLLFSSVSRNFLMPAFHNEFFPHHPRFSAPSAVLFSHHRLRFYFLKTFCNYNNYSWLGVCHAYGSAFTVLNERCFDAKNFYIRQRINNFRLFISFFGQTVFFFFSFLRV